MLEECGLEYTTHLMKLAEGDQFDPAFRMISPNAKMPAIVDHEPDPMFNAPSVPVFESAAILLYLAEKTGKFMPESPLAKKEMMEWLFWQTGNQGPMAGQLSHFVNYAPPEDQSYGRKRYGGEYERNLAVLETRLDDRPYIMGDYSICDIIAFPWVFIAKPLTVPLDAFPNVAKWRGKIKQRPAVIAAINLYKGEQNRGKANVSNNTTLYNQTAAHLMGRQEPKT